MQQIAGYTDHTIDVRGLRLHYLEWGEPASPPMVLLHGLTGHAHIWDHMASQLAERFHLFAPDQRGHGDTGHTPTYATQDFVDDLEAMIKQWRVDRFVLMGLSMGGHNAMAYALAHPERVSRLIIIDIPARMDRRLAPNYDQAVKLAATGHERFANFEEAVQNARAGTPTAPEPNLRYRTHWNLKTVADAALQFKYDPKVSAQWDPADLSARIGEIVVPTLLVRGGRSTVFPLRIADAMIAAIPDAELVEIAESGHSVPTDRPEDLAPTVLEWLERRAD
jgi:pimeloyl-ACP methyl ester carboxylesterase